MTECQAVTEFFGKTRNKPLFIGSVKSNIGHTEITAGLCSLLKAIVILRTGVVPGNLHSEPLDTTLPGIKEGKLRVSLDL